MWQWNQQLLQIGRLQIGTIHGFRDTVRLPPPIGDADEGKKRVHHSVSAYDSRRPDDADQRRAIEEVGGIFGAPTATVVLEGVSLVRNYDLPNAYVLCVSLEKSAGLMQRFRADSCVEIDFDPFARDLSDELNATVGFSEVLIAPVIYTSRDEVWDPKNTARHPGFLKDPSYGWQAEARIVWTVKHDLPTSFVRVESPFISRHCRRVL
jgi:hypothetical protein